MPSKSNHVAANGKISFFFMAEKYSTVYIPIPHLLYPSSIDDCFHILATVNNTALNIRVHISFQISVFIFFRYIPRSGIAGSYGSSSFLRNLHTVSIVAAPIYTPTNSVQGFPFIHILANICYLWSFGC